MLDRRAQHPRWGDPDAEKEIARLNRVIQALMQRTEGGEEDRKAGFTVLQAIAVEEQVRKRTAELETALRENESVNRALRESEAKFRGLVDQSWIGIVIIENGKFTYSNARFDALFGYTAEEIRQLGPLDLAIENYRPLIAENIRRRLNGEAARVDYVFRGLRKDGSVIDVEVHSNVMKIGGEMALISMLIDVTERTRALREMQALQEKLYEQSTQDALTGLYNRRYLNEALGRELVLAARHEHPVSVIICDLDHFKGINDCYGHSAGDEVLRAVSGLIRRHARASDICCRYGGEEFLLILPQTPESVAVTRAEALRRMIAVAAIPWGGTGLKVTASFGIATFPQAGRSPDALISAADRALYAAKTSGRNRVNVTSGVGPGCR
jgi:diguanylate cyclase (GGDEF)-like protein/PAS domain S-box-containing protein